MEVKLSLGKNVIIDATNLTKEIRVNLNNIAKRYSANTYAVVFPLSIEECMNRAKLREDQGGPHISKVVYYTMKKKYVAPTLDEGFEYIGYVEQI
jgi:predicted kinase